MTKRDENKIRVIQERSMLNLKLTDKFKTIKIKNILKKILNMLEKAKNKNGSLKGIWQLFEKRKPEK